jgi:hypothetical protein
MRNVHNLQSTLTFCSVSLVAILRSEGATEQQPAINASDCATLCLVLHSGFSFCTVQRVFVSLCFTLLIHIILIDRTDTMKAREVT